jgi:hypothetical protein
VLFLFKQILVIRRIPDEIPLFTTAYEFRRPRVFVTPMQIDTPIIVGGIFKVVVDLCWAPIVDVNNP